MNSNQPMTLDAILSGEVSQEQIHASAKEAVRNFNLKKSLGDVFLAVIQARQYLDNPALAHIFAPAVSYLSVMLHSRCKAGDFTVAELRVAVVAELEKSGASDVIRQYMMQCVDDFKELME